MAVTLRVLEPDDLETVVALSLRAWAPVFASLRAQLGEPIFRRLHPDWASGQAAAVRSTCTDAGAHVVVAVEQEQVVGFVVVVLEAYHPRMGAVEMLAVDPDRQRHGLARALMAAAHDHLREQGMDIAVVETGGDPGHAPARRTYEASGYTLLPIARYFRMLADDA